MKKIVTWICVLCMLLSATPVLASETAELKDEVILPFTETAAVGSYKPSTAVKGYDGGAHYWGKESTTYELKNMKAGKYELFFWLCPYVGSIKNMDIEILHNGELASATLNPNLEEGEVQEPGWVSLGVYEFSGDGTEYVKVLKSATGVMRQSAIKYAPTDKPVTESKPGEASVSGSGTSAGNAVAFEQLPDFGNIFEPYLTNKAPEVLEVVSMTTTEGTVNKQVLYSSYDGRNKIFAQIYYPEKEGKYPGVVLYHGGAGNAYTYDSLARLLAKENYVVISPELPGIGEPTKMKSEGSFKARGYNQEAHVGMYTDPRNSAVFEGILSAIDAVHLLKSLDNVIVDKIGIAGGSWGGYMTTEIASLLGDEITCAYSWYGCAYYDSGTHWSRNVFPKFGETNEKLWMKYLDASVNIENLSAAYFIEAPTNDSFFYPDGVKKTLDNINGEKNKAFTANIDHNMHPNSTAQVLGFFNYYLKDAGVKLVSASDISAIETDNESVSVSFNVSTDREVEATVCFADTAPHWNDKEWKKIPATIENGKATVVVTPGFLSESTIFYGFVTDENGYYASTDMVTLNDLNPREMTQEDMLVFAGPTIIINSSDPEAVKSGYWLNSTLAGYEEKSVYALSTDETITYTPFLKAGKYKVSAFVVVHERNQKELLAVVNSAGGETEIKISTQIPRSDWVEIGEFEFNNGANGSITLSGGDTSAEDAAPVRLDAVKFELIENETSDEVKVILNGEKLNFPDDQKPVIVEGRTLVAFRTIFEALGLSVGWDDATNTAMGEKEGMKIELPIGNPVVTVNGVEKTTDVPAQLINSRTFVPLRFLSEALGFEVLWDDDTKTVTIKE